MTADLVLVPYPTPWRAVCVGDVMRAPNGELWTVLASTPRRDGRWTAAVWHPLHGQYMPGEGVDRDELVPILTPMAERDALGPLVEQLGAQHIGHRLTPGVAA